MFKDIIVGVTPTGIDDCAVRAAAEFARKFESKLYLVHVAGMAQGWGSMETLEPSGETAKINAKITENYAEVLEGIADKQIIVVPGIPHTNSASGAQRTPTCVMDRIPRSMRKALQDVGMAGSTLERVSQKARCPVMVVHKDVVCKEPLFSKILVATDFSDQAECAVSYGGQMARQYKADLTVMNVVENGSSRSEIIGQLEDLYGPRLEGVSGCGFEACRGKASMEILRMGQQSGADLIVMAHHSKERDPEKAFLGSTVTQVALNAPCPTMSVNRHFDLRCGLMYDQSGGVTKAEATA